MSLAFAIKDEKRFWVATNSTIAREGINIPNIGSSPLPIFKVNDVLICYCGDANANDDIVSNLDFSKIRSPLSERQLYENFFVPMSSLVKQDALVNLEDDGTIRLYPSTFLFLSSKAGYLFDGTALGHLPLFGLIGTASDAGSGALNHYINKLAPADLAIEVVRGAIRFSTDTTYPILLANSEDDEATLIKEDGSRIILKIPTWKKGGCL